MSRIPALDPVHATGRAVELFAMVQTKLGRVPNLMRTFAHSPAVLEGYLALSGALAKGVLPARVREQVSLVIGATNACDYCIAAHSFVGGKVGLAADEITAARLAQAADPKTDALLKFTAALVESRGQISDSALAAVRAAGATDAEIVELVAHVGLQTLTNYTNHLAQTAVDFPAPAALLPVGA